MLKQSALSCPSVFPDLSVYQSCPSVCPVLLPVLSICPAGLSNYLSCPSVCPVQLSVLSICPAHQSVLSVSVLSIYLPSACPDLSNYLSCLSVQLSVLSALSSYLSVLLSVLPACYHVHLSVLLSTLPVCLVHLSVPSCPSICPVVCVRSLSNRNLQNHCPFL